MSHIHTYTHIQIHTHPQIPYIHPMFASLAAGGQSPLVFSHQRIGAGEHPWCEDRDEPRGTCFGHVGCHWCHSRHGDCSLASTVLHEFWIMLLGSQMSQWIFLPFGNAVIHENNNIRLTPYHQRPQFAECFICSWSTSCSLLGLLSALHPSSPSFTHLNPS